MLQDILALEEGSQSALDAALSMQRLINSGMAWKLQGAYGRAAMAAIRAGENILGPEPTKDYYGNKIPGRDEVVDGTIGSVSYAAKAMGAEWVEALMEA